MKKFLIPTKIITEKNVIDSFRLLEEKTKQINLNETNVTTFNEESYIVLDFGKEIPGGIRILTKDITNNCAKVHIRFGESVGECMSPLGYKNSTNDHSPRDFYYEVPFLSDITIGSTGFRFVRIDFDKGVSGKIKNIYAVVDEIKEVEAYFKSDNELLNQIFDIAAYTNAVCIKNDCYWDGIKRDRLCWIGDAYPIYKAAKYLYSNNDELINSLALAKDECPLPLWVNWSPMYSFWWMLLLCEDYLDNKDFSRIEPLFDFLNGTLKQASEFIHPNGDISFHYLFIDWPSHFQEDELLGRDLTKKEDEITGCRFLCLLTLRKVLYTFKKLLNEEELTLVKQMISYLEKGNTNVVKFKQIAALGVEADILDENKKDILLSGGANGLSTFQSYFILKAVNRLGDKKEALNQLLTYHQAMIDLGATSFFEDFDLSWANDVTKIDELPTADKKDFHGDHGAFCYKGYRHSLCHGWSSGVVAYIFEYIVGIKQIDVDTYEIRPDTLDIGDIKCAFATRNGLVHLEIKDNKVVNVISPKGINIR